MVSTFKTLDLAFIQKLAINMMIVSKYKPENFSINSLQLELGLANILKHDTVKMYTFDIWCPHISAQGHQIPKILVSNHTKTPQMLVVRHNNFEDPMPLSRDIRTPKCKSVHFNSVTL